MKVLVNLPSIAMGRLILLRGIQLTHVNSYRDSIEKMVLSYRIFTVHEANTCVALPNPDGVRCSHFPSVITTIMDLKVLYSC
jgi:hypothetical protein